MGLSWANRMTILRILLVVPFVICMLKINSPELNKAVQNLIRYASFGVFLVMAVSDGLDGYLARTKKQITKLGIFLDPVADKLLITSACLLLCRWHGLPASARGSLTGRENMASPLGDPSREMAMPQIADEFLLPPTVVVLIIGKDLLLVIGFVIVYFLTSQLLVAPVLIGKIANTLQLVMVGAILLAPEISHAIPGWIWFLRTLWWSSAGTAILATLIYIRNGSRYIEKYENRNI